MEQKHIVVSVIALVLIIAGMFIFAYLKKNELSQPQVPEVTTTQDGDSPYADITRIDAKHFYIPPTHTIAGEMIMPTPCDLLNWTTRTVAGTPEQVVVDFTVVNHAESCVQVATPQRFKVSFDASENAVIRATLQGRELQVNLVPALPGETPDDFELFIKG